MEDNSHMNDESHTPNEASQASQQSTNNNNNKKRNRNKNRNRGRGGGNQPSNAPEESKEPVNGQQQQYQQKKGPKAQGAQAATMQAGPTNYRPKQHVNFGRQATH